MANSAAQNPGNRVGRNSGAGAGGVSEIVPTEAEARRGLEAGRPGGGTRTAGQINGQEEWRGGGGGGGGGGIGSLLRLGALGALGAGVAAVVTRRLRKPKRRRDRLREWVGLSR